MAVPELHGELWVDVAREVEAAAASGALLPKLAEMQSQERDLMRATPTALHWARKLGIALPEPALRYMTVCASSSSGSLSPAAFMLALEGMHTQRNSPAVGLLLGALSGHVRRWAGRVQAKELSNALHGIRRVPDCPGSRAMLAALAAQGAKVPTASPYELGAAFSGLQAKQTSLEVEEVLAVLTRLCSEVRGPAGDMNLSTALHGLRLLSDTPSTRGALTALLRLARAEDAPIGSAESLSAALGGIARHSGTPTAPEILRSLCRRLAGASFPLDAQYLSMCLYALHGYTKKYAKPMLQHLGRLAAPPSPTNRLDSQGVGMALYGLRCVGTAPHSLMSLIVPLVAGFEGRACPHGASAAMFGVQRLVDPKPLLAVLVPFVSSTAGALNGRQLANALYGMHAQSSEVSRALTLALLDIDVSWERLDGLGVGMCLYGIKLQRARVMQRLAEVALPAFREVARRGTLTTEALAMSLYGLHRQAHKYTTCFLEVLAEAAAKVDLRAAPASEVSMMLYGLFSTHSRSVPDSCAGTRTVHGGGWHAIPGTYRRDPRRCHRTDALHSGIGTAF
eukprot:TRINITY_DN13028_c0_g1_i2.p1 TRINITY_DN13028_c0_g1~~TRINITY_DN13028_c0_g1_i2.p1  ORF type:complete len:577 (+),score=87.87 TRINITY_DN13028_c0_g1_i2:35-1732(+)